MANLTLNVNGGTHTIAVEPNMPLLWVLRDVLNLTGTKFGCGIGLCGACTVIVDGKAQHSCRIPVSDAVGKKCSPPLKDSTRTANIPCSRRGLPRPFRNAVIVRLGKS